MEKIPMKKLLIALLLLACAQQAYGMKRLQQELHALCQTGKYSDFISRASMYKHVPSLFSAKAQAMFSQPLQEKREATNQKITTLEQSIFRKNCGWLLPASATLLAVTVDPSLLLASLAMNYAGSFGLKQQYDLHKSREEAQELTETEQQLNTFFAKKEQSLKTT